MIHPSINEIMAELSTDLAPEVLAETVLTSFEQLYAKGETPTRELLIARGAEMISAIRAGERIRLLRSGRRT